MTARKPTPEEAEAHGRAVVKGRSLGRCQLHPTHEGTEWSHRVAKSRGGTWAPVNGLWLCRSAHAGLHAFPRHARDCGWMVDTNTHPSTVPALIQTQTGPGWWWLDEMGPDGHPTGLARIAEPDEIPPGMWAGTFTDAVTELRRLTRGTAA